MVGGCVACHGGDCGDRGVSCGGGRVCGGGGGFRCGRGGRGGRGDDGDGGGGGFVDRFGVVSKSGSAARCRGDGSGGPPWLLLLLLLFMVK